MQALKHSTLAAVLGLASAFAGLPTAAQVSPSEEAWVFELTPYFWAAGVRSAVNLGVLGTQTMDIPVSNLLSALDFGLMGTFEARKGRWGALVDVQYVKLGTSSPSTIGPFGNVDMKYEQQLWTFAGFYRVADDSVVVDVLGGARYIHVNTDVTLPTASLLQGPTLQTSDGWWDGIVGARVQVPLNPQWSLIGYADVGAGGSDLSWQVIAGATYRFSKNTSLKFGYRYFKFERDSAPVTKASMDGPYIGVGVRF